MEHDCEIFDDSEALLDALLASAQWETPGQDRIDRLTQAISGMPAPVVPPTLIPVAAMAVGRSAEVQGEINSAALLPESSPISNFATAPVEEQSAETREEIFCDRVAPTAIPLSIPLTLVAAQQDAQAGDDVVAESPSSVSTPLFETIPANVVTPRDEVLEKVARPSRTQAPSRRPARFLLAMAASVLVAVGGAWLLVQRIIQPSLPGKLALEASQLGPLPGRPPTPYELWIISPHKKKRSEPQSVVAHASAHQTGSIDSPISSNKPAKSDMPPLAPIDPRQQRIAEFCRVADVNALAMALMREVDVSAQRQILQSLLARPGGAERYLDLVLNPQTRARSLAVLQIMPEPPTDLLLAELDSPSVARRFAAAKAIGSICHGQTLPRLQRMIEQNDHRREALATLNECKDSGAQSYARQLRSRPAIASELIAVRNEMQQLF